MFPDVDGMRGVEDVFPIQDAANSTGGGFGFVGTFFKELLN